MSMDAATEDFFRLRLDHMVDLRHPLAVLSSRMPWQDVEASGAHLFRGKVRAGKKLPGLDLFGEQIYRAAVMSNAGRPRVPLRTMIALLYFKYAFNESDECLIQRWAESQYGNTSVGGRTLIRRCRATPRPWSNSACCWAKKVWSNCWPRPSLLP